MSIVEKIDKYLQYVDQGVYSLSTLLLSLLAPVFFSSEKSAEILYLISFLLLFLAATTAIFTTQMLSMHDEKKESVEKVFKLFFLTLLIACFITFIWQVLLGLENSFFFYFSYIFCAIDFLRRVFIRQGKELWSLYISISCFVFVPTSYYISSISDISFWKIAFFPALTIVLCSFLFYISFFSFRVVYSKSFIKVFSKNGFLALTSFFLVWCTTQGIFVILYDSVENSIFVQQKLIFSVLGFFNIIMIVQENRFQPLYTYSFIHGDIKKIKILDKSVNIESHILFSLCIFLSILFYIFSMSFYFYFLLFSIFRYFIGLSKAPVYYFRAAGKYVYLVLSNSLSLFALGFLYLTTNNEIRMGYVIPIYFLVNSSVFLLTIVFFRFRSVHAKHWSI